MALGTKLEPEARKLYNAETGKDVRPVCVQSSKYEWLRASLDGLSTNHDAVVFWWQAVLMNLNSTFLVGRAISASNEGQYATAGDLLVQAVDRSPSSTFPRSTLVRSLLAQARTINDGQQRIAWLLEARRVMDGALDRNPLDYRAWVIEAEIMHELVQLDRTYAVEAVATQATAAALLPGLRPPRSSSRSRF
jgi:hypothetical protein